MLGSTALKIGALAERTGTTPPTIRYYEAVGLLPRAGRQGGGQRRYGDADVRRLLFIRRCRDFGFSVEQVRTLVDLVENPERDCREVLDLAAAHLAAVRAKLAELRALERDIAAFAVRCATTCAGGPGPACVPLAQLAAAGAPPPRGSAAGGGRDRRARTGATPGTARAPRARASTTRR
jgi:DNA-binding transcriptional MerR regulator